MEMKTRPAQPGPWRGVPERPLWAPKLVNLQDNGGREGDVTGPGLVCGLCSPDPQDEVSPWTGCPCFPGKKISLISLWHLV